MPQSNGLYVNYAALCEKVLHEADGVLSLIRIIDQVTITITTAGPVGAEVPTGLVPPAPPIAVTFALGLKSSERMDDVPVKIRIDTPSAFKFPEFETTVELPGEERGAAIVLPMQIPAQDEGIYWFVVEVSGEVVTRVPLRVFKQIITQTVPPGLS
jgi:hypothetical protein